MAVEVIKNLETYLVQLEQVEAALTSDPTNEELLRLQGDLQEVISLTKNLPDLTESFSDPKASGIGETPGKTWKVSDECSAIWSQDGRWYNGVIDAITEDGMVAISFKSGNSEITKLSLIRDTLQDTSSGGSNSNSEKSRKRQTEQQRLIAKKKKQKKFDRQKMIEEAHEEDKAKWQAFSTKFSKSKKMKGVSKKSIFATPEAANGRVGIGTCGIGGKPMTSFSYAEKWRKGT